MRIYLVGFMGSGKSTVGRRLATRLGWAFVDLDKEVELRSGIDVPTLFEQRGEEAFRDYEYAALAAIAHDVRVVVATGGGTFVSERNVELIKRTGVSVWLNPPFELLVKRIEGSHRKRPLFRDPEQARALLEQRLPAYRQADLEIRPRPGQTADSVADGIVDLLMEDPCAT